MPAYNKRRVNETGRLLKLTYERGLRNCRHLNTYIETEKKTHVGARVRALLARNIRMNDHYLNMLEIRLFQRDMQTFYLYNQAVKSQNNTYINYIKLERKK